MLSTPQEVLELQTKQKKAIAVTALAFPPNDVNNFVIGSEEGDVYQGNAFTSLFIFEVHLVWDYALYLVFVDLISYGF